MIQIRFKNTQFFSVITLLLLLISCNDSKANSNKPIAVGANQTSQYLPLLLNNKVGIVANQTSVIFKNNGESVHLIDSLINLKTTITKVFAPEHGFRGKADAAEHVADGKDAKTGLPIISLYGKNKKPTQEQLENIDIVLFDIQDVGVRFYTYISTMHYVMEACAEKGIPVIVLDRPNPNGHYVDGPMLDLKYRSFVGMHPVPLVYGMTIGEYAQMINGERWLEKKIKCELTVIPLENYTHITPYSLPIRPSPNLPNDVAINLYPSLGFFEGTTINAGRGTEFQFQRYGAPDFPESSFNYIPQPNFGSKYPKHQGETCFGMNLRVVSRQSKVNLSWLIDAYQKTLDREEGFFGKTFTLHAGSEKLQEQLETRQSANKITESWQKDLEQFKIIREKYLIYN